MVTIAITAVEVPSTSYCVFSVLLTIFEAQGQGLGLGLEVQGHGQGLGPRGSSRTRTFLEDCQQDWVTVENGLYLSNRLGYLISVCKPFFAITSCTTAR